MLQNEESRPILLGPAVPGSVVKPTRIGLGLAPDEEEGEALTSVDIQVLPVPLGPCPEGTEVITGTRLEGYLVLVASKWSRVWSRNCSGKSFPVVSGSFTPSLSPDPKESVRRTVSVSSNILSSNTGLISGEIVSRDSSDSEAAEICFVIYWKSTIILGSKL